MAVLVLIVHVPSALAARPSDQRLDLIFLHAEAENLQSSSHVRAAQLSEVTAEPSVQQS